MKHLNFSLSLSMFAVFLRSSAALALDTSATAPSSIISCSFPTDIPAATATQAEFDKYSWRMFTALSQPASKTRGTPNCDKALGSTSDTVWRSFKFIEDIFLPDAVNPGPWNSGLPTTKKVISGVSKVSSDVNSTINEPVGGWLIDQRGNPTYFQIAANETSYNYILNNDLYNKNTVDSFSLVNFPDFSTEVKASWRILTTSDVTERYMTIPATVATFDRTGEVNGKENVTLGLVGFHIMTKATGYPQWVWATFEQVDNVSPTSTFSSYYNSAAANPNQSPCADNAMPCATTTPATFHTPTPLTRVTAIAKDTAQVNTTAQTQLAMTFLKYYELITTQRASDPNDPGNPAGSPTPGVSANTTMESYIQSVSSCMDCHSTAEVGVSKKSDYSFLLSHAQTPTANKSK